MKIPEIKIGTEFTIMPTDQALAMSLMPNSRPDSYSSNQKFGFYVEANQIRHFKQFSRFKNGQISAPGAIQDFVNGDTHFDFKCIVDPTAHTITVSEKEVDGALHATDSDNNSFLYSIYRATSDNTFKFFGFLDFTECVEFFRRSKIKGGGYYIIFSDIQELLFDYQTVKS